jgi:hypothetical protein
MKMSVKSNNTFFVGKKDSFEHGDADPRLCAHEWWEDTQLVYTSCPPKYKQICKLCGQQRFTTHSGVFSIPSRWKKV